MSDTKTIFESYAIGQTNPVLPIDSSEVTINSSYELCVGTPMPGDDEKLKFAFLMATVTGLYRDKDADTLWLHLSMGNGNTVKASVYANMAGRVLTEGILTLPPQDNTDVSVVKRRIVRGWLIAAEHHE